MPWLQRMHLPLKLLLLLLRLRLLLTKHLLLKQLKL
jgi:hypothetical protein